MQTLQLRLVILKIPKDSGCSKNAECGVRSAECGFAGEPPPEVDSVHIAYISFSPNGIFHSPFTELIAHF